MQFITSLFGDNGGSILTAAFALGAVLVLIVIGVWLLKMVFKMSGSVARGRNRRLSVVDTLQVDPKRQLLIVRRDNVEHLVLIGGPQDLVVETGIAVQEQPATQPARRPIQTALSRKPTLQPEPVAPTVNAQRPPSPVPAALVPVQPAAKVNDEASSGAASAVEQLRDLGKPAGKRATRSLRHTGLLRPVTTQDVPATGQNSDFSASQQPDSVKQDEDTPDSEGAAFEHDKSSDAERN